MHESCTGIDAGRPSARAAMPLRKQAQIRTTPSRPWRVVRAALWPLVCGLTLGGSARAEPMRLGDASPRRVHVQFEVSASDRPELLDVTYSEPIEGRLESGSDGTIRVRVDGALLERGLLRDRNPVPGSFSDYLWVFDARTGEVLSASFAGTLIHPLRWGFGTTEVEARVEARMTTTQLGGFRSPTFVWGRRLQAFCSEPDDARCTLVSARGYEADRGYVNAVGFLKIDARFVSFSTFSALGEARFSELPERAVADANRTATGASDSPPRYGRQGGELEAAPRADPAQ